MKRITDLYNDLTDEELFFNDGELLDCREEAFDEEEKKRILLRTMKSVKQEKDNTEKQKKGRSGRINMKKKLGILIIAAVFLATLSVSAAEHFHIKKELAGFLGVTSQSQAEELESMAVNIYEESGKDISENEKMEDEDMGVKIRAAQMISDGEILYIYFEIELPEGVLREDSEAMKKTASFYVNTYQTEKMQTPGNAGMFIRKSKETPNQYYAVTEIDMSSLGQKPEEMTMTFGKLGYVEMTNTSTKWVDLIPGKWELKWKLEYQNMAENYTVHKEFKMKTGTVIIQNVKVSPLSIKLTGICLDGISSSDGEVLELSIDGIILKDGTCQDLFRFGYVGPEGDHMAAGGTFENIVDVKEIKGVRVKGEDLIFR